VIDIQAKKENEFVKDDFEKWLASVVGQDRVSQLKEEARISVQIIKARYEKGMSQQALADAIGVAKSTIEHIEAGLTTPNIETIFKISQVLSVPFVIDGMKKDEDGFMEM
jgi:XRE family transcriptional regulator, regulator of sulfur utilization